MINHWLLNEMSIKAEGYFHTGQRAREWCRRQRQQQAVQRLKRRLSQATFHMQPPTVKLSLFSPFFLKRQISLEVSLTWQAPPCVLLELKTSYPQYTSISILSQSHTHTQNYTSTHTHRETQSNLIFSLLFNFVCLCMWLTYSFF